MKLVTILLHSDLNKKSLGVARLFYLIVFFPVYVSTPQRFEKLIQQIRRNVAAVLGDLLQDGLVQPDVHLAVIAADEFGRAAKFLGQFLARIEAAVDLEHLKQVHDGDFPIEAGVFGQFSIIVISI